MWYFNIYETTQRINSELKTEKLKLKLRSINNVAQLKLMYEFLNISTHFLLI